MYVPKFWFISGHYVHRKHIRELHISPLALVAARITTAKERRDRVTLKKLTLSVFIFFFCILNY